MNNTQTQGYAVSVERLLDWSDEEQAAANGAEAGSREQLEHFVNASAYRVAAQRLIDAEMEQTAQAA